MAERRPPGFNVDLGFYDSEEVLSIPRKIRAAAVGVWMLCGAYSANKLTDGYVSEEALRNLGCTPAIRAALTSTKPQPLWDEAHVGGIWFTRWAKWQRTCAEVKAYREADAERKRKAREAKRNGSTSDYEETSARTSTGPSSPVRAESRTPKTETKTETKSLSIETSSGGVTSVDAHEPPQCRRHPNSNSELPCAACQKRRLWDEQQTEAQKRNELDTRRRLKEIRENCQLCQGTNLVELEDGVMARCDHGMQQEAGA